MLARVECPHAAMPPQPANVALRVSAALCGADAGGPLWPKLQEALQESGIAWSPIDHVMLGGGPPQPWGSSGDGGSDGSGGARWAYLESDFPYAPHRALVAASTGGGVTGAPSADEAASSGGAGSAMTTRFPLLLAFEDVGSARAAPEALGALAAWLRSAPRPFGAQARLLLVLIGEARSGVAQRQEQALVLSASLVRHGVGSVEVCSVEHASRYVVQCALSVAESRKRRLPSRFKVAGVRCQTLPRDPQDRLRLTWVSQLMQLAGVSEEIAKSIAGRHSSPGALMQAISDAFGASGASSSSAGARGPADASALADAFLADLEFPIRGKKGTRRLGPVVSRRIFALFHPEALPEHVLV